MLNPIKVTAIFSTKVRLGSSGANAEVKNPTSAEYDLFKQGVKATVIRARGEIISTTRKELENLPGKHVVFEIKIPETALEVLRNSMSTLNQLIITKSRHPKQPDVYMPKFVVLVRN